MNSVARESPRRLGAVLLGSFAITVGSFVCSTWLADRAAYGLLAAAESIVTDAVPAIRYLAKMRSDLRTLEGTLDSAIQTADSVASESEVRNLRRTVTAAWQSYLVLPPYAGERDHWPAVASDLARLDASIDQVLLDHRETGRPSAQARFERETSPTFDRMDGRLSDLVDFNAGSSIRLGNQVLTLRRRSRRWEMILDAISLLFAVLAALTAIQLTRRYARLMQRRVSGLEHFAGRVAHDVRSPLTSVGLALNLAERNTSDPRMLGILGRGSRTLQRVGQLVDGLLVFAHAGAPPARDVYSNAADVIRGVIEDMRLVSDEKQVALRMDAVEAIDVGCSPGVLASLVSNLVGNAFKYMGDAPIRSVIVRARTIDSQIRFEVEDTGPCVPYELRPRVFDPHVRGSETTEPGFGLGLATVRRLAEAHGGAVGLEARKRGSLFWFELPRAFPSRPDGR